MTLERGVHSRLPLADLKLFTLRIVSAWDLECFDPGSPVTVRRSGRDSIIIKRRVSDGSRLAKPQHLKASGFCRAVSNTNSTLHFKRAPEMQLHTCVLGYVQDGTWYLMSGTWIDRP